MITDLYFIKTLMIDCAELGAANYAKSVKPGSDDLTKTKAYEKFGEGWVDNCIKKGLVKGKRKGPAKNSPIYLDLPVKLTTPRRFILTTLRRCKLTTYF